MIISVGYRVKFQEGIIFRKCATKILKDYMLKGYVVNQKRLDNSDAKEILKVIGDYSKALDLLENYDHRTLKKIKGNIDERRI